jgi:dihydropteroate synthase
MDTAERMVPSVAAALIAVQNGAHIVRVHDVKETVQALKVWQAVQVQGTSAVR